MEIKFLGSGSGKTSLKRFHSSLYFSSNEYNLIVDAGDGISKAILSQKISFNQINGILISHLHPDHFAGLSGLIVQMKLQARSAALDIFIHKNLAETVKNILYQSYIFNEKLEFEINYIEFEDGKQKIITKDLSFIPKQNSHLDKYKKYDKLNLLSFSCSSFLFVGEEKKIFYTGDIGNDSDLYLFNDYEIDLMITEISHISLMEIYFAGKKLKVKKIYLTHISDEDEEDINKFLNSLEPIERGNIVTAYDGMAFNI